MCVLCYELADEGHWSDVVLPAGDAAQAAARGRHRRARILNELLGPMGLQVRTPGPGRAVVVANRTGRSMVAAGLPTVWEAADRLGTRPLDPLDPELLDRLEARRRGT